MKLVKELFLRYVKENTQSDFSSSTFPSTTQQLSFAQILAQDCKKIGLSDVEVWEKGYVTATLPSNVEEALPVVAFIAHMDTSGDFSGEHVCPQIIESYDGNDIVLSNLVLSPKEFPILLQYIGQELITTNGKTLLGGDDKAGIAEILAAMDYLIQNPHIPHGTIKVAFTPDEEVGRGVSHFDVKRFGADFAYTIDGGELGELEIENFHAARALIEVKGKSVHPGYAKNMMKNASLLAVELISSLPQDQTPQNTENREGFFHVTSLAGKVESAQISIIIRDFDKNLFNQRKDFLIDLVSNMNKTHEEDTVILNLFDEYANMYDVLKDKPFICDLAFKAMLELGITPIKKPIRGGTDGSRLSFMGLPCPNLFTGNHNGHGPYEFVVVPTMEKAVDVIVKICSLIPNTKF